MNNNSIKRKCCWNCEHFEYDEWYSECEDDYYEEYYCNKDHTEEIELYYDTTCEDFQLERR